MTTTQKIVIHLTDEEQKTINDMYDLCDTINEQKCGQTLTDLADTIWEALNAFCEYVED